MATTSTHRARKEFGPPRPAAREPEMPQPEVMTAEEVAQLWRVHKRSVVKQAARGKIPGAFRVGNLWRFYRKKILPAA